MTLRRLSSKTGLAAAVLALLLAGCGGEQERDRAAKLKLPPGLAADLADRSDSISELLDARDACAARTEAEALQRRAIAAINARRVPAAFQEELTGWVNALVGSIRCASGSASEQDSLGAARQLSDWLRANS